MPKKYGKHRAKSRARDTSAPLVRREAGQPPSSFPASPKQAVVMKPETAVGERYKLSRHMASDLRHTGVSAAIVLLVLLVLYFVLR